MQLVYDFGAKELEPVVDTIQRALENTPYTVNCNPTDSENFYPTDDSFSSATLKMKAGELASFALHPKKKGLIRYAAVFCPFYAGGQRSGYLGTIEYVGNDYKPLWNLILGVPGLSFACLGDPEGVELEDKMLTVETFPWTEWPLVIGALRDPSGLQPWVIREGPEMRWFRKRP